MPISILKNWQRLLPLLIFCLSASQIFAQVTGIVLDERAEPLPFASIFVQNSTSGTTANAAGEFRLNLPRGKHPIVFQYLGYRQKIETVEVADKPIRLKITLEPNELELGEVVVRANAEDPAYPMMRQAIARRSFFKKRTGDHSADVYIKGIYKIVDAPKKIFGKSIGDMEGLLDSNRTGVLYLSESVSTIHVQASPERKKEVMISSKTSGDPNGFSLNRANLVDFSCYDERINVEREILSPLADNAFSYYRFRFLGSFRDENGFLINKIEVIPRRKEDPVFAGEIYLVDEQWNVAAANLILTGGSINQPVLDTLRFKQEFVPGERPDRWVLFSQVTSFKFGIFGFKIGGAFNSVFSNYNLKPDFADGFFGREIFKIEKTATERDSIYWEKTRPVPLTFEENRDYIRKDSLYKLKNSDAYLDSLDRKNNRLQVIELLTGYTFERRRKHLEIKIPGLLEDLEFNTVQGGVVGFSPKIRKKSDERGTRFWEAGVQMNYGFADDRLRVAGSFRRRFNSVFYPVLKISGGSRVSQFNENEPISPLVNSVYSIYLKENYLKLYDKNFGEVEFSRDLSPGIWLATSVEFADRRLLANQSNYSRNRDTTKFYTPNLPVQTPDNKDIFQNQKTLFAEIALRFRFRRTYLSYPKFREYENSKLPEIVVRYRKAIPGAFGSAADFDFLQAKIEQRDLTWGIAGFSEWSLAGGFFARKNDLKFFDFRHIAGNRTIISKNDLGNEAFLLAPYYSLSTSEPFAEAHFRHHFKGFFLDKIPFVRRLNWAEVVSFNAFSTSNFGETRFTRDKKIYWEGSFGFENIGWKAFRMLQLHFAWGFFGGELDRTGLVLGFKM